MNQSIVGKYLTNQLDKIHKANLDAFKINEEDLKTKFPLVAKKNSLKKENVCY